MHDENNANNVTSEEKKQWWEKDEAGYDTDLGLEADFEWDRDVQRNAEIKKEIYGWEG